MAEVFFDNPPALAGDEKSQLQQVYRYLSEMSGKLNTALNSITIEQMEPDTQLRIRTGAAEETQSQYNGLKSLIIKTAEIVHTEMDEISTTLEKNYTAISSQFGELDGKLTNDIKANAEGVSLAFEKYEEVKAQGDASETFIEQFSKKIFLGVIDENAGTVGIAIGENITAADGTLVQNNKMATFTMDELAFWHGEVKMAWFTDNVFHITNGEIEKTLKIGNHKWIVLTGGAIGLISG